MVWGAFSVPCVQSFPSNEVDKSVMKNLVNSMFERIFQVINRSGSCTDY
uniref:Uncharacterized protein n=1 Tax=Heterorhabditis bacteriophora TaxID=37862 RepID=A0A1I7X943_HETBA